MQAGEHDLNSHTVKQCGLLSVKQRAVVKRAARAAPLSAGRQVHYIMLDFSPCKQLPFDRRSQDAVNGLVPKTRNNVESESIPGLGVAGSEGSMIRCMNSIAESLPLQVARAPQLPGRRFSPGLASIGMFGASIWQRCHLHDRLYASPPQQHGASREVRMAETGP